MSKQLFTWSSSLIFSLLFCQNQTIESRVQTLLAQMTVEEKIGQLNQYNGFMDATGPLKDHGDKHDQLKKGMVGAMLNVANVVETRRYQELALNSRLKIPLLFGLDVIHGYKTTFPIPLAEAASWDLELIERTARIAATEASASGIHWTFAPMVDIGRDPRWGRVMEGAGEDTYLGSKIAYARVKGFQGEGLGNTNAVMACAKHFAAYGAAEGGRDYNTVDMSLQKLWNTYLPPFESAEKAGVATFMNAFNDLNGIPATGNRYLQRDILKAKWSFNGFVVSDWGSIAEMINHGYAVDGLDATLKAISAGSDMDMESGVYVKYLKQLLEEGEISIDIIDDAVRRILCKKFELGLFEDPFKFCNKQRQEAALHNPTHTQAAREIAQKSIVLLKNKENVLPINHDKVKTIAFIGPMVKLKRANHGFWSIDVTDSHGIDSTFIVSQWEGLESRAKKENIKLLYAKGSDINTTDRSGFDQAVKVAKKADLVILSVGEGHAMSGEAKSRSSIHIPGVQENLVKAIHQTGKPVVVLINAGRPLIFNWIADNVSAVMYTWWLGSEAGNAIADVLFGSYNPSGKLPMTFPRSEGQIPIYYNYFNTGRPFADEDNMNYVSAYTDLKNSPKYPFGFGLSYTTFAYEQLKVSPRNFTQNQTVELSFTVSNTGNYDGREVVQLYVRDRVGSIVRPVKELKGFQNIFLKKGERKTIHFTLTKDDFSFYDDQLRWIVEPGDFDTMVGSSAADTPLKTTITLTP